jgi:homoserine O-acetyltransferase
LIGEKMTLNPKNYFIIIPALFGNGQSSSPSNQGPESKNVPFPKVSMYDNVRAQHKLVVEHFGITHLRAVLGWSMGAAQTFQWASQYPDFMDLAIPFCGAAKVALHNMVMLEGVKSALLSAKSIPPPKTGDIAWPTTKEEGYRTWSDQEKSIGLKALGRVYAGW